MDEDLELIQDFRTESLEHMSEIEPLFLEIESLEGEAQLEIVNRIFRAAHSVKGAAGFFGLDSIQNLAHVMENLLMRVRDGELVFHSAMTDALLAGVDKLSKLIEALPEVIGLSIDDEIAALKPLIDGTDVDAGSVEPAKGEEILEPKVQGSFPQWTLSDDQREEAARFGQKIYGAVFDSISVLDTDVANVMRKRVASLGKLLGQIEAEASGGVLALHFASVLEPDLLADALEVPLERLRLLSVESCESVSTATSSPAAASAVASEKGDTQVCKTDAVATADEDIATSGDGKPSALGKRVEAAENLRVSVDLLDKLMDLAGELVLGRNQLLARLSGTDDPGIKGVLQNIDIVTSDLQSNIMNTRMQPVGNVFKKYHRVVRDLSRKLGKRVDLEISGSDVELDKSIIELLSDPLTHLVRNSLDHGIESPGKRKKAGKPEVGKIELRAFHEGGQVNIEIVDDGGGIDPAKTREAAVKRNLMSPDEAADLSDDDAVMLIFSAGFSLAAEVTEVSGRGVGMDVVRANITKLGGKIEVDSEVGKGTSLRIRLPLTLAIVPSLIVVVGEERFAVPQVNLVEIVRVKASEISMRLEQIKGADVLRLRGQLLPLARLVDVLGIPRTYTDPETGDVRTDRRMNLADRRSPDSRASVQASEQDPERGAFTRRVEPDAAALHIVVLRSGGHRYGLIVDRIADSEEIVVKPLSQFVKGCRCYAGATIMGDGRVAMILDVTGIAAECNLRFHDFAAEANRRESLAEAKLGDRKELILFANSASEQFAVELRQIMRLEKLVSNDIERIGGSEYMQHLGKGLPLIRLENELSVNAIEECDEYYVLIPNVAGSSGGILASRVIDTIETQIEIDRMSDDPACVCGRALIQGHLTTILDAEKLLDMALGESL